MILMFTEAYGEDHMCLSGKTFSKGSQNVEDDERPGTPSTSRTEEIIYTFGQIFR